MTGESQGQETSVSLAKTVLAEVYAGAAITLEVQVSCLSACDLRGNIVKIIAEDTAVVNEVPLTTFDEMVNKTGEFSVPAPSEHGFHTWTVEFPLQEHDGILYEESSTSFSFAVIPHKTSVAVWNVPSPVAIGDEFRFKVGVRCFAECGLTDKRIEIYDHSRAKVATSTLGSKPWPGTSALYWTEVELEVPDVEGHYTWEVKFPKQDLEPAHAEAAGTFSFSTASPPDHQVIVSVINKDSRAPVSEALVILHPYRCKTDQHGLAKVDVPKGGYELYVSKNMYQTSHSTVWAEDGVTVVVEMLMTVPYDPDEEV